VFGRTVPDCSTATGCRSSTFSPRGVTQSTSRRSTKARRRAVQMRTAYLHAVDDDDDISPLSQTVPQSPVSTSRGTTQPLRSYADDDIDDYEARRLYEWTQSLSIEDNPSASSPSVFLHWQRASKGTLGPWRSKMHHGNPRGGDKNKKVRGDKMCWCLCLKCSKTHLQASLIPKFSWGDTPGPSLTRGRNKSGRKESEKESGRLRHGCREDDVPDWKYCGVQSL